MMKTSENTMTESPKSPSWLTFVSKAEDDAPLLRLMVLNPMNDAMSPMLNLLIDADPCGYNPGSANLRTRAEQGAE
jgi:hypothetical protein